MNVGVRGGSEEGREEGRKGGKKEGREEVRQGEREEREKGKEGGKRERERGGPPLKHKHLFHVGKDGTTPPLEECWQMLAGKRGDVDLDQHLEGI